MTRWARLHPFRRLREPHTGTVRRRRRWQGGRAVLDSGWYWRCSCLAYGIAPSRIHACHDYWDHHTEETRR